MQSSPNCGEGSGEAESEGDDVQRRQGRAERYREDDSRRVGGSEPVITKTARLDASRRDVATPRRRTLHVKAEAHCHVREKPRGVAPRSTRVTKRLIVSGGVG